MPLSDNFFGPGKKKVNITSAGMHKSRLVPKNHKKLNKNYCKIFVWCKVAKIGENCFFLNLKIIFSADSQALSRICGT